MILGFILHNPIFAAEDACSLVSKYEQIHRAQKSEQSRANLATIYNNCGIEHSNHGRWNSAQQSDPELIIPAKIEGHIP